MTRGMVYFLQVGTDGPIKIGFTKNPVAGRIRALQMTSPHALYWIGGFDGTRVDERAAHLLLKNSHYRAEWFCPTQEVMAFIREKTPADFRPVVSHYNPHIVRRGGGLHLCTRMSPAKDQIQ